MIRQALAERETGATPHFRWRGRDVSRVEGLSDAVLGFAFTLIVVSLEVPRTFDELLRMMRGVPAFAICFALLLQVWYRHYIFFRRYGMHDLGTIALNALLLFTILVYVYPLKFLFSIAVGPLAGARDGPAMQVEQVPQLFTIYGLGFVAIFVNFALLYGIALLRRNELGLDAVELFETRLAILDNLLYASVGVISILVANFAPLRWVGMAGMSYALLGVVGFTVGWRGGVRREAIQKRMMAQT